LFAIRPRNPALSVSYITIESAGASSNGITLSDALIAAGDLAVCFAFDNAGPNLNWQSPLVNDSAGNDGSVWWGLGHGILGTPTDTVSVSTPANRIRVPILRGAHADLDDFDVNSGSGTSAAVSGALTLSDPGGMVLSFVFIPANGITISDPANLPVNFNTGTNTTSVRGNRTADGGHGLTGSFTPDTFTWSGTQNWVRMTVATKTA
jgi:hypothetical protein